MTHVLKAYQAAKAGGVNARRLHTDVQTAGYVFGGNNLDNQMNYLNKTVRKHAARFKRGADGLIALA